MTSRRRFLSILAGVAMVPALHARAGTSVSQWRGIVLGAPARIVLDHPDSERLITRALDEIHRLEAIFSLHQSDSQLSRLNRTGTLVDPGFEMVELLSICAGLHARTNGAFDPTVQALWNLYARRHAAGSKPDANSISNALDLTGWAYVRFDSGRVSFARPGVGLTFNGVAQGYIADRVTQVLRNHGVTSVLINTGEISALGTAPGGAAWQVRLGDDDGPEVALRNGAIATSAPLGTTFDQSGRIGHILDPRTGLPGGLWSSVSVRSHSAAQADGLSTGFCLMPEAEISVARGGDTVWLS